MAGNELIEALRSFRAEKKDPPVKVTHGKDRVIPNAVKPGQAVICDKFGRGARVIAIELVCAPMGAAVEVYPDEGRTRGTVLPGALLDQLKGGELIVAQWAPYTDMRSDGQPRVTRGALRYPAVTDQAGALFTQHNGVWYHTLHGRQYLEAAKAAEAKPPAAPPTSAGEPRKVEK
jgi:hypothetical protein